MGKDIGRTLRVKVLRSGVQAAVVCTVVTEDEGTASSSAQERVVVGVPRVWGRPRAG